MSVHYFFRLVDTCFFFFFDTLTPPTKTPPPPPRHFHHDLAFFSLPGTSCRRNSGSPESAVVPTDKLSSSLASQRPVRRPGAGESGETPSSFGATRMVFGSSVLKGERQFSMELVVLVVVSPIDHLTLFSGFPFHTACSGMLRACMVQCIESS